MPLLDHFHPPLSIARHWEALHARWASAMADALTSELLPQGYYAEEHIHVGGPVEVDVGTFEGDRLGPARDDGGGGTAVLTARTWTPPAAALVMPALFPDSLEVLVFNREAGPTLVGAIELVSPPA